MIYSLCFRGWVWVCVTYWCEPRVEETKEYMFFIDCLFYKLSKTTSDGRSDVLLRPPRLHLLL